MRDVDALRAMANANRDAIARVMTLAGTGDVAPLVVEALTKGDVTEISVPVGTHLEWMALKRRGRPDVLLNVRWSGRAAFDAWQVRFDAGGYTYTFVVPKVCGNLSLASKIAHPVTQTAEVAPPPPPPPAPPAPEPAPEPVAAPPPPAPPVAPPLPPASNSQWVASGFVGSNFSTSVASIDFDEGAASVDFGGQIAYLWHGVVGGEGIVDWAPNVGIDRMFADGTFLEQNHYVNSYMANAIGAIPFGTDERFQPYVSGGLGAIEFRGDLFEAGFDSPKTREHRVRFGGNVGAGMMAFAGHWGVRGDVRYFKASTDDTITATPESEALAKSLLSGLEFWRANLGLSFRW